MTSNGRWVTAGARLARSSPCCCVFVQDQVFYPVEVKKTASPRRELAQPFAALRRLKQPVGERAVVFLCRQTVPLAQDVDAVPVGVI